MIDTSTASLVCAGIGLSHRGRALLDGIELSAADGEIVGLVGPRGSGKTALLRLIVGELPPSRGQVRIGGYAAGSIVARGLVGYAANPPLVPPELTGFEWLRYVASHCARTAAERLDLIRSAIELGVLAEFVGRRVANYSRGMAQRLALASAALCARKVVLLDESLGGTDPIVARQLRLNLSRLAAGGRLVILASHDLSTVEQLATRAVVLSGGRIAADISMAALLGERLVELSLNGSALADSGWLLHRFRGSTRTGDGVAIPLRSGLSVEQVLEECRAQRLAVVASRVRYRRLEDILVAAHDGRA